MSISPSFTAQQSNGATAGISPFVVFCDATATTSTQTYANTATLAFHNIEYKWDFGDTGSSGTGTWLYGKDTTQIKNVSYGPLAAHLFEVTEGGGDKTFTITLRTWDGVDYATTTHTVTVYDPLGANGWGTTYVISQDGNFSGAPTGTQITDGNWFSILNNGSYIGTNHRVRLKCGNTYTAGAGAPTKNFSNYQIDTWVGNAGSAKPIINATVDGIDFFHFGDNPAVQLRDVRLIGLNFQANGQSNVRGSTYQGGGGPNAADNRYYNDFLLYRMNMNDIETDENFMTMQQTGVYYVEITSTNLGYNSFSGGMINSAMMGSLFTSLGALVDIGVGNIRWGNANKLVFTNNSVDGSCTQRQHIKLHSQDNVPSTLIRFGENKFFGGSDELIFRISPQNLDHPESINNVIVENNWYVAASRWLDAIQISAVHATIRNNLFDFTAGPTADTSICVDIYWEGAVGEPLPDDINVYNNTGYSAQSSSSQWYFTRVDENPGSPGVGATNIRIRNNLGYAQGYATKVMIKDAFSRVGANGSNNVLLTSLSPTWVSSNGVGTGTFTVPTDFKLRSSDTLAKNQGMSIPVWNDFFALKRSQQSVWDIGFSEFDNGELFPWDSLANPVLFESEYLIMQPQTNPLTISKW